ncbi:hypothetical protein E8E12_001720 [Didymella heteroderae]|uniref:FAD-binding FR-type domain-containing protein n=1 Tax=Didymella heteroderae TaxID=1769908 RepID=A0A9P4WGI1_9PLEO|nr:hypothetical protein E8E12_001720 [Didymella heteroderae]
MHVKKLPFEIVSAILKEVVESNIRDGPMYTFGLTQTLLPLQRTRVQRYVKGLIQPEMLRWDATSGIRQVCWQWHEWAMDYALRSVSISRCKGGERWAELSKRRSSYPLYELIDRPTGTAVYRDPLASLKQTTKTFSDFPELAFKVRRMRFHGFHTAETNRLIADLLLNCRQLASLSVPWTAIRYLDSETWRSILTGKGRFLESLEFQCVEPTFQQAAEKGSHVIFDPLRSIDLARLRRLKISGDTTFMPITDHDLSAVARTATQLEGFHVTSASHVTIEGVMAVVKASRATLQTLEYNPQLQRGSGCPRPGSSKHGEHLCDTLRSCARLRTLSVSLPSACADLFAGEDTRLGGDMQVRAMDMCGYEEKRSTTAAMDALEAMLQAARGLIHRGAGSRAPRDIYVEIFFASCIFEPAFRLVHGDFSLAHISSGGLWPADMRSSGKGPYGSTGTYDNDEENPFQCIDEDEYFRGCFRLVRRLVLRYIVYPQLLPRLRFAGPWSPGGVFIQLIFASTNAFCVGFRAISIQDAGWRAAQLSLINLIPAYGGPHLSFLADVFGLSLSSFRLIHRSAGVMSLPLLGFHIATAMSAGTSFPLDVASNMSGLILAHFTYRNKAMGADLPRAQIVCEGDSVKVRLTLSRHVKVQPGQYVGLCIPALGFLAGLQIHPLTVTTWSDGEQQCLDFLVEPREGWTKRLLEQGRLDKKRVRETKVGGVSDALTSFEGVPPHLAFFTGPHGLAAPVSGYETVVMVASGYGIASHLPYLKQLLYDFNACRTHNRRIHLIWQPKDEGEIPAVEPLLNEALRNDTLGEGYILSISIYIASSVRKETTSGRRVRLYWRPEPPDLQQIFEQERTGTHIHRVQDETEMRGDMAVLVSATGAIRDKVRYYVRQCAGDKVDLVELNYQPA